MGGFWIVKPDICAAVFSQRETIKRHFLLTVTVPAYFGEALPGQFVMVRLQGCAAPFLSRPFSIYSVYSRGDATYLEIFYQVVGEGTEILSKLAEGALVGIRGPLGKGFDVPSSCGQIVLVAGGIGVAPLSFFAQRCKDEMDGVKLICYLGAGTAESLAGLKRLEEICTEVKISTDDGSRGYHGLVTDLFEKDMDRYADGTVRIYSCGPRAMLKSLQALLADNRASCQVSLEERMACGFGACLGCAVRIRSHGGGFVRVCTEGPVFDIRDVEFSE